MASLSATVHRCFLQKKKERKGVKIFCMLPSQHLTADRLTAGEHMGTIKRLFFFSSGGGVNQKQSYQRSQYWTFIHQVARHHDTSPRAPWCPNKQAVFIDCLKMRPMQKYLKLAFILTTSKGRLTGFVTPKLPKFLLDLLPQWAVS